jgi:hypothetical protein
MGWSAKNTVSNGGRWLYGRLKIEKLAKTRERAHSMLKGEDSA